MQRNTDYIDLLFELGSERYDKVGDEMKARNNE